MASSRDGAEELAARVGQLEPYCSAAWASASAGAWIANVAAIGLVGGGGASRGSADAGSPSDRIQRRRATARIVGPIVGVVGVLANLTLRALWLTDSPGSRSRVGSEPRRPSASEPRADRRSGLIAIGYRGARMAETRPITEAELAHMRSGRFPALALAEDQWHEHGYFYDPVARRFAWYEIDRKDQVDATWVVGSAAAVLAHVGAEQRAAVTAWLDAMPIAPCTQCAGYFGQWRSHGPTFPDGAFEVIDHEEIEVGTHGAVTVMQGVARCRHCGLFADFGCDYGPGYWFRAQPARG